jgi:hypothetical protein
MFSVLIYLPTYLQAVHGVSAALSGVHLLRLVGGLVVSQTLAGRQTARPGRVGLILIAGMTARIPRPPRRQACGKGESGC